MSTTHVPARHTLTITADLESSGHVVRFDASAGGTQIDFRSIASGGTESFGPYNSPSFFRVVSISGQLAQSSSATLGGAPADVNPSNLVVVNSESDLPLAVGGVITLEADKTYWIGSDITSSNRIRVANNTEITSGNVFTPLWTYTGTGVMFTGIDENFSIRSLRVNCPTGTAIDLSSPTNPFGTSALLKDFFIISCAKIGTFDNLAVVVIDNFGSLAADDGITVAGATKWLIFDIRATSITSTSNTFKGIDLGSSVHNTLRMMNLVFDAPSGAVGIEGVASSANLNTGKLATVDGTEMTGGMTTLVNISNSDTRWQFSNNDSISDSLSDALLSFTGNSTETTISTVDTPVKVNATWTVNRASRFTGATSGRATFIAERSDTFPVDVSLGLISSGGGTIDVMIYLALNGSAITNSGVQIEIAGNKPRSLSTPWQIELSEDDYVEVFVENTTNTTNIIVEHGVLRIR